MPPSDLAAPGPRVIAHRGASEDVAEHTLPAYQRALADGADGVECDVRLTRDGELVCIHDRRVERTSTGRGAVSRLELADLAELDFAAWKREHQPETASLLLTAGEEPDRDGARVLTLDRLLRLVVDLGRDVELAIETKHPTRYRGAVERRLVDMLRRYGLHSPRSQGPRVRVMSFSPTALRRTHLLAPGLPTVRLLDRPPVVPAWPGHTHTGPSIGLLRAYPSYVESAHRAGREVHTWTVNRPDDIALCLHAGVDVIITDRPRAALHQLGRRTTSDEPPAGR